MSFNEVKKEILSEIEKDRNIKRYNNHFSKEIKEEVEKILPIINEMEIKFNEKNINLEEITLGNIQWIPDGSYIYWVKINRKKI